MKYRLACRRGYIIPLDDLKDSEAQTSFTRSLKMPLTRAKFGAPKDIEHRPVYYNKDMLRELGWSDEEIDSLSEQVKNGEFTLEDMTKLAEEATKRNC